MGNNPPSNPRVPAHVAGESAPDRGAAAENEGTAKKVLDAVSPQEENHGMDRTEKIVIIVTAEEKEAIQRLAGGKGEVGRFIRYLCHQAALMEGQGEAGEVLGEEFKQIMVKAAEKMVNAAVKKAQAMERAKGK
jgi:hypothetical protein